MLEAERPNLNRILLNRVVEGALGAMTEIEAHMQKEMDALLAMLGIAVRELGGTLEVTFDALTAMQESKSKIAIHVDPLNQKTIITCQ